MKKQNLILSTALAAIFSSSVAFAEAEVTGKIVHESAKFTTTGTTIGAAAAHDKDVFKTETSARIYIDGAADELQDGATYHVELNLMRDSKGVGKHDGNESYTQRDALREAYVDGTVDDWSVRAGKQQVVWGTADGIKLLDSINPTDYSEMAQNQMEDSRIPVWMVNAEKELNTGGSIQIIASQAKANKIAGLNPSADQGHAFIMKGVDAISGKSNGFYNIVKDFGKVATAFEDGAAGGGFIGFGVSAGTNADGSLYTNGDALTVGNFASGLGKTTLDGTLTSAGTTTNLSGSDDLSATNPDVMFDYLLSTNLGTFSDFDAMTSSWNKTYPSSSDGNLGVRYKSTTDSGFNYSVNYFNHYDANPSIDIGWEKADGTKLHHNFVAATTGFKGCLSTATSGCTGFDGGNVGSDAANLVFKESLNRIQTLGGSFDMAVETDELGPVVYRGEFTYDKGVNSPVIDMGKLSYGDLVGALSMEEGDMFKYVLGADITALTNMMISGQFIQFRNLDYIDQASTGLVSGTRYTADSATMNITNGLNKAEKNKEFYSLFFSKPFGASGEHRWNNIFMFEENGGKWNRLDAEFSIDDDTQATVEYNKYWGDANTQFGQLEKSSNVQVGFKYSF